MQSSKHRINKKWWLIGNDYWFTGHFRRFLLLVDGDVLNLAIISAAIYQVWKEANLIAAVKLPACHDIADMCESWCIASAWP